MHSSGGGAAARRYMTALTALCLVVVLAVTGQQLGQTGWAAFISRPDGVGASESDVETAADVTDPADVVVDATPTPTCEGTPRRPLPDLVPRRRRPLPGTRIVSPHRRTERNPHHKEYRHEQDHPRHRHRQRRWRHHPRRGRAEHQPGVRAGGLAHQTTEQQSPDPGVDQQAPAPSDTTPDGCEHGPRHRRGPNLEVAADAIGIDVSDLHDALLGGATIAQVANDNGVDPQAVIDALVSDVQSHLATEVDEGNLTQDQADQRLADATARITDTVENGRPERPAGERPGHPADADTTQS